MHKVFEHLGRIRPTVDKVSNEDLDRAIAGMRREMGGDLAVHFRQEIVAPVDVSDRVNAQTRFQTADFFGR